MSVFFIIFWVFFKVNSGVFLHNKQSGNTGRYNLFLSSSLLFRQKLSMAIREKAQPSRFNCNIFYKIMSDASVLYQTLGWHADINIKRARSPFTSSCGTIKIPTAFCKQRRSLG